MGSVIVAQSGTTSRSSWNQFSTTTSRTWAPEDAPVRIASRRWSSGEGSKCRLAVDARYADQEVSRSRDSTAKPGSVRTVATAKARLVSR